MADLLDTNGFRAGMFGVAMLAMVVAWRREKIPLDGLEAAKHNVLWPMCWLLIGAVYATMALALAFELSTSIGGFGREIARNEEWYESRRPLQAAAVAIVGITWLTVVIIGIWRVPQRRRRYLPSALLCTSLVCFAIIRLVSLHHVDRVIARTSVADVPSGTLVELVGVVAASVLALVAVRRPIPDTGDRSAAIDPRTT